MLNAEERRTAAKRLRQGSLTLLRAAPAAVARTWPALLALSLAAVACLVRLDPPGVRLVIDPSTEPMLPVHDPAKDEYRSAVRDFGDDEVFVIAMETPDVFSAENLGARGISLASIFTKADFGL